MSRLTDLMSLKELETYEAWRAEQHEKCKLKGLPYHGAIGGEETFSFTSTSLGLIIRVYNACTDEEVDITEYEGKYE